MPEKTVDHVTRLLSLLGYLADHHGVAISELAGHFGVSEAQILKDIDLLWVTGTPGYYPEDLIDFTWSESDSHVSLREARGFDKKVRLAPREALALAVAVQWMRELGVGIHATALESLSGKLTGLIPAVVETTAAPAVLRELAKAIETGSGVLITYVSAEDETTERTVFPRLITTDGAAWYVEGWCTLAGAERTFRLDRIVELHPADPTTLPVVRDRQPTSDSRHVAFVVDHSARYVAEDLPGAQISVDPDGIRVHIDVSRTDWLVRLALGGVVRSIDADLAGEVRKRSADALHAYEQYTAHRMGESSIEGRNNGQD